jgi:hypothetical protein
MALADQLFSQVRYDPLGAAVQTRWNAFNQRRNLRDSHTVYLHALGFAREETLKPCGPILWAYPSV